MADGDGARRASQRAPSASPPITYASPPGTHITSPPSCWSSSGVRPKGGVCPVAYQTVGANVSEVAEEVKSGQLRLLGVMAPERSRFLPDAPTFREQGFNQVWSVSRGIAAPAGLPKDVEAKLTAALEAVLSSRDHQGKAEGLSLQPQPIKGADYVKFLKENEASTKRLMGW